MRSGNITHILTVPPPFEHLVALDIFLMEMICPKETLRDTGDRAVNTLPPMSPQAPQDIKLTSRHFQTPHIPGCPPRELPGLDTDKGRLGLSLILELHALDLVQAVPPVVLG